MALFLLDHHIDRAVSRVVQEAGHRCVTAGQIGMATATDEEISIWADGKRAIVITADREFIDRRRERTFGLHVWLVCDDQHAVEVMGIQLSKIVAMLDGRDSVVLRVSRDYVEYYAGRWE